MAERTRFDLKSSSWPKYHVLVTTVCSIGPRLGVVEMKPAVRWKESMRQYLARSIKWSTITMVVAVEADLKVRRVSQRSADEQAGDVGPELNRRTK